MTHPARFIVIEGLDGAGTTTQAKRLVDDLNSRGQAAVYTYEPSEGPIGTLIRQALHRRVVVPGEHGQGEALSPHTLTLLFAADRMDHLQATILPALGKGVWAVSDRYDYSTRAYQAAEATDEAEDLWIQSCNSRARRPDLTFFLRIRAEAALKRLDTRASLSIFEKRAFLEKVAARYERIFAAEENTVILDGEASLETIAAQIKDELKARGWL